MEYEGLQDHIKGLELPEIETWENQYPDRDYRIRVEVPEFTCICPKTGLPDFATLTLDYVPDRRGVELKSLKHYLAAYRPPGIFREHFANKVLDDLLPPGQPRPADTPG